MLRSPLSGDCRPGNIKWTASLLLLLILPQSLSLPPPPPGDSTAAGAVAAGADALAGPSIAGNSPLASDTTTLSDTGRPIVPDGHQRSPGDITASPPPGPAANTAAGSPAGSESAATDAKNTAASGPRAELQSTSDPNHPGARSKPEASGELETSNPMASLSTEQTTPYSEMNSRQQSRPEFRATDEHVGISTSTDMKPTLGIDRQISSTSAAPDSQPSTQVARDPTEETSATYTNSFFKRSTLPSQPAETGSPAATTQLSDIRDTVTTKLPGTAVSHTDGEFPSGTGPSADSSEPESEPLTSPGSVRPALLPLLPQSPTPSPSSTTKTPASARSPDSHPGSDQSPPPPVHHLPAPIPLDQLHASASPPSPLHPTTLSEESVFLATSPVAGTAMEGSATEPVPVPVTKSETEFSITAVDCAPELTPDVQRWRPGTDIQINFPLTIPGECTPAEQCSVSTVLDQRVTVQTSDTVTVRFVVSASGGGSPAAASLALRRADPGITDCPIDHAAAPPALLVSANQRRRLGGSLLRPGINNFFGRISLSSEECFRLVVTVRSADCGDHQLPCGGRGHCVARPNQDTFTCSCCSTSSGPYCGGVSDPCAGHPCDSGATCTADGSSHICICPEDHKGPNCTLPADTCGTCLNGGTCLPAEGVTVAVARCLCPVSFTGDRCQQRVEETSPCRSSACLRGVCQAEGDTAACLCPPGYRGQFCETRDVCSSTPCQYGGTCQALTDESGFHCSCAAGYRGSVCQFRELPLCTVHPCANGGTCWDEGTSYYCTCQHGFAGKHCEVPPGLIGHFGIHHIRSGVPVMAAMSAGLFIVIAVAGCCYCRSVGVRPSLGRLCRPVNRCRSAVRCCPRRTYKQFSEDQRKNLLEMGYSHSHQPIVEPIFADVDYSEAAEMPLIT